MIESELIRNIIGGIGITLGILMVIAMIWNDYWIKHMTLEQAIRIAKSSQPTSIEAYIQARKILLDNGYWKYKKFPGAGHLQNNIANFLGGNDYILDLDTGQPIAQQEEI